VTVHGHRIAAPLASVWTGRLMIPIRRPECVPRRRQALHQLRGIFDIGSGAPKYPHVFGGVTLRDARHRNANARHGKGAREIAGKDTQDRTLRSALGGHRDRGEVAEQHFVASLCSNQRRCNRHSLPGLISR
jgi:hypothetical protein